jgi:hypothetical protein
MKIIGHPARGAVGVVVAVMLFVACGSSSKPSSNSSTTVASGGKSDTCKALNDFKSSLSSLRSQVTLSGGADSAAAAVKAAQDDLEKIRSDVKSADKPKVDALQKSLDHLKTAVQNMNGLSDIPSVIDAARPVESDVRSLYGAISAGCSSG